MTPTTEQKHTPGPWTAEGFEGMGWGIYATDEEPVVWEMGGIDNEANARLIAAAPDLLKACQAFVTAYEKSLQLEKTDAALRLAKLAIAEATGAKS